MTESTPKMYLLYVRERRETSWDGQIVRSERLMGEIFDSPESARDYFLSDWGIRERIGHWEESSYRVVEKRFYRSDPTIRGRVPVSCSEVTVACGDASQHRRSA